jgi:hypothetical protein
MSMFQQIKFFNFFISFSKVGNGLKRNLSRNSIPGISNYSIVTIINMEEFESIPAEGKTISLYFPNMFSRIRSLGNASSARIPAIASKVIAIFGG